jgi:glycine/D-amino acid oxidase-like deaminating enzyme
VRESSGSRSPARCPPRADVTVFERDRIGAGTSSRTFAWVNSNGKSPESYHELNLAGIREHEQLQDTTTTEGRWFFRTGT